MSHCKGIDATNPQIDLISGLFKTTDCALGSRKTLILSLQVKCPHQVSVIEGSKVSDISLNTNDHIHLRLGQSILDTCCRKSISKYRNRPEWKDVVLRQYPSLQTKCSSIFHPLYLPSPSHTLTRTYQISNHICWVEFPFHVAFSSSSSLEFLKRRMLPSCRLRFPPAGLLNAFLDGT